MSEPPVPCPGGINWSNLLSTVCLSNRKSYAKALALADTLTSNEAFRSSNLGGSDKSDDGSVLGAACPLGSQYCSSDGSSPEENVEPAFQIRSPKAENEFPSPELERNQDFPQYQGPVCPEYFQHFWWALSPNFLGTSDPSNLSEQQRSRNIYDNDKIIDESKNGSILPSGDIRSIQDVEPGTSDKWDLKIRINKRATEEIDELQEKEGVLKIEASEEGCKLLNLFSKELLMCLTKGKLRDIDLESNDTFQKLLCQAAKKITCELKSKAEGEQEGETGDNIEEEADKTSDAIVIFNGCLDEDKIQNADAVTERLDISEDLPSSNIKTPKSCPSSSPIEVQIPTVFPVDLRDIGRYHYIFGKSKTTDKKSAHAAMTLRSIGKESSETFERTVDHLIERCLALPSLGLIRLRESYSRPRDAVKIPGPGHPMEFWPIFTFTPSFVQHPRDEVRFHLKVTLSIQLHYLVSVMELFQTYDREHEKSFANDLRECLVYSKHFGQYYVIRKVWIADSQEALDAKIDDTKTIKFVAEFGITSHEEVARWQPVLECRTIENGDINDPVFIPTQFANLCGARINEYLYKNGNQCENAYQKILKLEKDLVRSDTAKKILKGFMKEFDQTEEVKTYLSEWGIQFLGRAHPSQIRNSRPSTGKTKSRKKSGGVVPEPKPEIKSKEYGFGETDTSDCPTSARELNNQLRRRYNLNL